MGRITNIEEKLAALVEKPFLNKKSFDPLNIEISLKRQIEQKKKNILGKIVIPNSFSIVIDKDIYNEYEPFFDSYKASLAKSLDAWIKEQGYELAGDLNLRFRKGILDNKSFVILASYKKEGDASSVPSSSRFNPSSPLLTQEGARGLSGPIDNKNAAVATLIHTQSSARFTIYQGEIIIGRSKDCDITITDPTVSEIHAYIHTTHGKVILADFGSRNGTRVNYERIHDKVLAGGDRIIIGNTEMIFKEL